MPNPQPALSSFSERIMRDGKGAALDPTTLVGASGTHQVFYTPFSHVETRAKLAIVGITPGTTQLEMSYDRAQALLRAGLPEADILRDVKSHGAFGGAMRTRLLKMLRHFGFASLLGVRDEADLWGSAAHLLHSTSVVPHAAFVDGKMFNGTFEQIRSAPALLESFERDFVPELAMLPADTVFLALGSTPLAALDHCTDRGLVARERILGALAHPSGSGGSQVDIYVGERDPATLNPGDPVIRRVPRLLAQAERVRQAVALLRGDAPKPQPQAAPTAPQLVTVAAVPIAAFPPKAPSVPRPAPTKPSVPLASRAPASGANDALHAFKNRGEDAGMRMTPHLHKDGCYVVSPTKFKQDYIRVRAEEPLEEYLGRGLSLRMSAEGRSPSLVSPASIHGRSK